MKKTLCRRMTFFVVLMILQMGLVQMVSAEETTTAVTESTTVTGETQTTTVAATKSDKDVDQIIISSATKWYTSQKAKITLKKIKDAKGYQISIYKTKNNAKKHKNVLVKKLVKKAKATIKSKKLKKRKKLFVRARAYKFIDGQQIFGKWSKVKQMDIVVTVVEY